jgi:hypothetical protein
MDDRPVILTNPPDWAPTSVQDRGRNTSQNAEFLAYIYTIDILSKTGAEIPPKMLSF